MKQSKPPHHALPEDMSMSLEEYLRCIEHTCITKFTYEVKKSNQVVRNDGNKRDQVIEKFQNILSEWKKCIYTFFNNTISMDNQVIPKYVALSTKRFKFTDRDKLIYPETYNIHPARMGYTVTASLELPEGMHLDMMSIAMNIDCVYDPTTAPSIFVETPNGIKVTIFPRGSLQVMHANDLDEAKWSIDLVKNVIEHRIPKKGLNLPKDRDPPVNFVMQYKRDSCKKYIRARFNFKHKIKLNHLALKLNKEYNCERSSVFTFSYLIDNIYPAGDHATFMIYHTGMVGIYAYTYEGIWLALEEYYPIIRSYFDSY